MFRKAFVFHTKVCYSRQSYYDVYASLKTVNNYLRCDSKLCDRHNRHLNRHLSEIVIHLHRFQAFVTALFFKSTSLSRSLGNY